MFDGAYPPGVTGAMIDRLEGVTRPERFRDEDEYYEALEAARDIRDSQIEESFLDAMEIPRDSNCRECEWIREAIIDQYDVDDDLCLPEEAFEVARRMCEVCKKHTPEERNDALKAFFEKEEL